MNIPLFEKTDKGREEIATRRYKLSPKLRSLLVMIDGSTPTSALLKQVSAIGLNENSLTELLEGDFIRSVTMRETS